VIGTVDLVIEEDTTATRAAAVGALQRGQRVLVVLQSTDRRVARRLRRRLLASSGADRARLRIMTGAEVVCADGLNTLEAVVVRRMLTGRLSAVNAAALVSFDAPSPPRRQTTE